MNPHEIAHAYDQITHIWERKNFDRQNGLEPHRRAISFAKNCRHAIDIGCGSTGRFIDLLTEAGYVVEGLDASAEMLRLASARHPSVTFHHADICQYDFLKKYDFITAWDSIWHIPLSQQHSVLEKIVGSLNHGGIFIFSFGGTEQASEHKNADMGPEIYYSTLGTNGFLSLLIKLGCDIKHLQFDQQPELHAYVIAQKIERSSARIKRQVGAADRPRPQMPTAR